MKIGILTQTLHNNYGGLLQNYALQQVLIRAGHEPCTIDHDRMEKICKLRRISRRIKAYIRHWIRPQKFKKPGYVANTTEEAIISQHTRRFIDKYICHTETLYTHKGFREIALKEKFQGYIVGSDQCWRPRYNKSFLKEMFLNFVEEQNDIKRISYAASFGKDEWNLPPETIAECARLAQKFDLITVREKSGLDLCRKHLGVEVKQVLDPTMLLSKDDYIRLVEKEQEPLSPGNLFYYILDPSEEKKQFITNAAKQQGLVPFTMMPKHPRGYRSKSDIKNHIEDCVYPSVTSWLRAFMDAEMTIVDSFHGMVFSIIFNKPFWVIGNQMRGMSRFTSLLKEFGLENRLVEVDCQNVINLQMPINWEMVNQSKEILVNQSIKLIYNSLNVDTKGLQNN